MSKNNQIEDVLQSNEEILRRMKHIKSKPLGVINEEIVLKSNKDYLKSLKDEQTNKKKMVEILTSSPIFFIFSKFVALFVC